MPICWKAVRFLEKTNLRVITASTVSALQNRKLFRMHKHLIGYLNTKTAYCTNVYTKEIMKTVKKLSFSFWIWNRDKVHIVKCFFSFMVT